MAGREDYRIFVGGLSWEVTERQLEKTFSRYGKVIETQRSECCFSYELSLQIMVERDTGRPRGFGFITFSDRRGMEDSIREMHGHQLCDRVISVNKAEPKLGGNSEIDHGSSYRGSYTSGGRGNFGGGGDRPVGQDECFKCGRLGHWARDCPSAGGGGGGGGRGGGGGGPPFASHSRYGGGAGGGDRFGDRDRFIEDRYDGGRYGERDRFEGGRDLKYGGGRDRFESDRYPPPGGDRFGSDRYGGGGGGGSARYPPSSGFGRERGYERDAGPRGGVVDRYGAGGPTRTEDRSYRSRAGPYDRPNRAGRPSSFDRY